ncbi:MAG TPA: D-alanine--poly(phosphoribitol) ligase subunit DltC [Anaerolineales bacterium]|nr:D-alanine--poly(phosphoribitol) ligase subunit DltC [Anaerolineales bacterium]
MSVSEVILSELEKVTGTDQVRRDLNLDLFGEKILDSFGTVELIVALSDSFGIEVSPGEIDRELWATPQKIIAYFEERIR